MIAFGTTPAVVKAAVPNEIYREANKAMIELAVLTRFIWAILLVWDHQEFLGKVEIS